MIGNAHLDPVWLWRWPEGCAEAIGTCWAAIDLLETHPGFIFTRGEALVYRWIEELEPELFARIRRFVADGRWAIVNGWWIQPDCNLPDGEAFIRQALYGKHYFRERFGVDVTVGYNVGTRGLSPCCCGIPDPTRMSLCGRTHARRACPRHCSTG